jgi:hypothetical protein
MSTSSAEIQLPLEGNPSPTLGRIFSSPSIYLAVRTARARLTELRFKIDPGSNVTSIPMRTAEGFGIAISPRRGQFDIKSSTGRNVVEARLGQITARFPTLPGYEFEWPCIFVPSKSVEPPDPILGLTGLAQDFMLTYDTTYRPGAPYGILSLHLRPDHRGRRVRT